MPLQIEIRYLLNISLICFIINLSYNHLVTMHSSKNLFMKHDSLISSICYDRLSISLPIYKDNNISVECRQVSCFFRIISYSIHYNMKNMQ